MFTQEQIAELRTEWMRAEENARTKRDGYISALRDFAQENLVNAEAMQRVKSILSALEPTKELSNESHQENPSVFQKEINGESAEENGNTEMFGMSTSEGSPVS